MNHIQNLTQELTRIGFKVEINENVIVVIGVEDILYRNFSNRIVSKEDFLKLLEVLQVVIEVDDPELQNPKFLFQNCSLKVYFEGWDFFEIAKMVKFDIAIVLNESGIFNGMGFEIPKDHSEVIVP
ncbi:MAG: hypothetical protein FJ368_01870 [Pelagibacterales bacterium]|nr:hypothetical protein [Pelagibacterales bacterium]